MTCDCEVYEICPSCAPSEPAYAKAAEFHNRVVQKMATDEKRTALEREIGRTFAQQQKERVPAERTRLWNRCLELIKELETLNDGS